MIYGSTMLYKLLSKRCQKLMKDLRYTSNNYIYINIVSNNFGLQMVVLKVKNYSKNETDYFRVTKYWSIQLNIIHIGLTFGLAVLQLISCSVYFYFGMLLFWNRSPTTTTNNAAQVTRTRLGNELAGKMDALHAAALRTGVVTASDLEEAYHNARNTEDRPNRMSTWYALGIMAFIMAATPIFYEAISFLLGVRCFLPNNHLVWEATRPIADCGFCLDVNGPLVLNNMTRDEFTPFAYSSQPIIIKNAVAHWPARQVLTFDYLKELYERIPDALDYECEFLQFRTDFKNLRDLFAMKPERANLSKGEMPWYVGWSNCHQVVLDELRKLYPRPHFLPVDAEMPKSDYIFMGYEQDAFMHLDYIPRLMWQAQLQGNKSWILAPTPECDHLCKSFSFYVEPGDAVLVDTRIWYHGTSIPKGQFALTIQSEYG